MSNEEPTITVDLSDEDEEWVQYARRQNQSGSDAEIDEESLEAETRANLERAVYRYLESLDNHVLDGERLELYDHQLLGELASLVVRRAPNVEATRRRIQDRLRTDENVSPFDLPQLTRQETAEYLVEEAVGKAEVRNLATLLLEKERMALDTSQFATDTPRAKTDWVSDGVLAKRQGESSVKNRTRLNSQG